MQGAAIQTRVMQIPIFGKQTIDNDLIRKILTVHFNYEQGKWNND